MASTDTRTITDDSGTVDTMASAAFAVLRRKGNNNKSPFLLVTKNTKGQDFTLYHCINSLWY